MQLCIDSGSKPWWFTLVTCGRCVMPESDAGGGLLPCRQQLPEKKPD